MKIPRSPRSAAMPGGAARSSCSPRPSLAALLLLSATSSLADRRVVECDARRTRRCCGDGVCDGPETISNCFADCPGVTTTTQCDEEPHSDSGGGAVVFGIDHRKASAQECCDACQVHAQKHPKRGCNSWVFCPLPVCWGLDTGWNHTFGECWLKYQADVTNPLYGQRGLYSEEYRRKHRSVRNGPPSHVPWTGGVIGGAVDRTLRWTTGPEGMVSSRGDELTNWRAWEPAGSYEKRCKRAGNCHEAKS